MVSSYRSDALFLRRCNNFLLITLERSALFPKNISSMYTPLLQQQAEQELSRLDGAGLLKRERVIAGPQDALISLADGRTVLNLCANNYLGLSSASLAARITRG